MAGDVLGWGILGCGWVARDYGAPAMAQAPSAQLVAVCDLDPEAMAAVAAAGAAAACRRHGDWRALLANAAVEAVYVATPNHLHAEQVMACAAAGKHVLCEKPMAIAAGDAAAMVVACDAAGVVYATAFDQRFHPAHQRLKALVAEGQLGTVTQARIRYACWLPPHWAPDNWRIDRARAGGGAMIDLAPHGLDLLEMILGEPWQGVSALTQRAVHAYAVDDGAILSGAFPGGALGVIQVGYNCPDPLPRRVLEVVGTRAMAVATNTMGQTPGGELALLDAATGAAQDVAFPREASPFVGQIQAFSAAVLGGVPFPFAGADDVRRLQLLLGA